MARQNICKQGREDINMEVNMQSLIPASFSHYSSTVVQKDVGTGLCVPTLTTDWLTGLTGHSYTTVQTWNSFPQISCWISTGYSNLEICLCLLWESLLNVSSIDSAWDMWEQKFMSVMEGCIPKVTTSKQWNLPGINRWFKLKAKKRNSIYRKTTTTNSSSLWCQYVSIDHWGMKLYICLDNQRRITSR